MRTFRDYLHEKNGFPDKFAMAKDNDYQANEDAEYTTICFSPTEMKAYQEGGKTHGLASHSIKHLNELRPDMMNPIVKGIKSYIRSIPALVGSCQLWNKNKGLLPGKGESILNKASNAQILNYMDFINDKVQNHDSMTNEEKGFLPFLKKLSDAYKNEIDRLQVNAIKIDKFNSEDEMKKAILKNDTIAFKGWSNRTPIDFIIDLKRGRVCICSTDYVRTMFAFTPSTSGNIGTIKTFMNRRGWEADNQKVRNALRDVASGKR